MPLDQLCQAGRGSGRRKRRHRRGRRCRAGAAQLQRRLRPMAERGGAHAHALGRRLNQPLVRRGAAGSEGIAHRARALLRDMGRRRASAHRAEGGRAWRQLEGLERLAGGSALHQKIRGGGAARLRAGRRQGARGVRRRRCRRRLEARLRLVCVRHRRRDKVHRANAERGGARLHEARAGRLQLGRIRLRRARRDQCGRWRDDKLFARDRAR